MSRMFLIPFLIVLVGVTSPGLATNTPNIELATAVHFLTPGGEAVRLEPGTYEVEATDTGLKLLPEGRPRMDAILLEATVGDHEETLEHPVARYKPAKDQEDVSHLAVLLPDGTGLEAIGSTSGVWPRALRGSLLQRKKSVRSQRSAPVTQRPGISLRPDLVITSYDDETNVLQVKNIGNAPAVFSQGGPLVSWFTDVPEGNVPAGGVIQPGQTIALDHSLPNNSVWAQWYCPGAADPTQYAYIHRPWVYSLPQPNGPEGQILSL